MNKDKIAVTLDHNIVIHIDELVRMRFFKNRSRAVEKAVEEKLERIEKNRLARECAKLDPKFEKAMAEEGINRELSEWPEY